MCQSPKTVPSAETRMLGKYWASPCAFMNPDLRISIGRSVARSRKWKLPDDSPVTPISTGPADADPITAARTVPFTGSVTASSRSNVARLHRWMMLVPPRTTISLSMPAAKRTLSSPTGM